MRAVASIALRVARRLGLDEVVGPAGRARGRAARHRQDRRCRTRSSTSPATLERRRATSSCASTRSSASGSCASAPSLAPVAPLVRSSQERWDGSGYPDGLRRDEIPIGSRIIAVCDAYHSMRSAQPYRRPCAHQDRRSPSCAGAPARNSIPRRRASVAELGTRSQNASVVPGSERRSCAFRRGTGVLITPRHPGSDVGRCGRGACHQGRVELRLSEVLAGLSHALDITEGQPAATPSAAV